MARKVRQAIRCRVHMRGPTQRARRLWEPKQPVSAAEMGSDWTGEHSAPSPSWHRSLRVRKPPKVGLHQDARDQQPTTQSFWVLPTYMRNPTPKIEKASDGLCTF